MKQSIQTPSKIRHHRQRGSVYVLVLGVSMIVAVIGLSAMMATRIQRRTFEGTNDASVASDYAQSAIDIAMLKIKQDVNWRATYIHDTWVADQTIGSGTFRWKLVDQVDTDLSNDDSHLAQLLAWGMKGNATQKVSVQLEPFGPGLTCLEVVMHAGNNILHTGATTVTCNQTISANNTIDTDATSVVNSNVEVVNAITGTGTYNGNQTTGMTPRAMPSATVFDYYIANGTPILASSLDVWAGELSIEECLISPATNPFGTGQTNSQGIYVIDCLGQDIQIRNCRLVGTLVLLNAGSGSHVQNNLNWEPAVANYPVFLVQGNMAFLTNVGSGLDEGSPINVNFNPIGTPYQGTEDTDTSDIYPSVIKGLVYVSGNVQTLNYPVFDGVMVVGVTATIPDTTLDLTYQPTFLNNPPSGFMSGTDVRIMAGSWKQEVD